MQVEKTMFKREKMYIKFKSLIKLSNRNIALNGHIYVSIQAQTKVERSRSLRQTQRSN